MDIDIDWTWARQERESTSTYEYGQKDVRRYYLLYGFVHRNIETLA